MSRRGRLLPPARNTLNPSLFKSFGRQYQQIRAILMLVFYLRMKFGNEIGLFYEELEEKV